MHIIMYMYTSVKYHKNHLNTNIDNIFPIY